MSRVDAMKSAAHANGPQVPPRSAVHGPSSRLRTLLVLPALAALVCGVLAGLARLGLPVPGAIARFLAVHGALMVGGFFGTLIGLERAVALGGRWPYLAPLLSGLSVIAVLWGVAPFWPPLLMSLAALMMLAACYVVWRRQPLAHHAALAFAALAWLLGNGVWLFTQGVPAAVPLWASFLVLTIAAERLELSRFLPTPAAARRSFRFIVGLLLASATLSLLSDVCLRVFSLALFALACWLLRYDIARRTVRSAGLTRYMAVCLLSAYAWLALGAMLGAFGQLSAGQVLRDAALHALLLGFVMSMVFGHAPVIVPAITRLKFRWHAGFYVPLLVLHLSLGLRTLAGLFGNFALRQWAAIGNSLVLVLFFVMVLVSLAARTKERAEVVSKCRV